MSTKKLSVAITDRKNPNQLQMHKRLESNPELLLTLSKKKKKKKKKKNMRRY